jgi:hypothetical protein
VAYGLHPQTGVSAVLSEVQRQSPLAWFTPPIGLATAMRSPKTAPLAVGVPTACAATSGWPQEKNRVMRSGLLLSARCQRFFGMEPDHRNGVLFLSLARLGTQGSAPPCVLTLPGQHGMVHNQQFYDRRSLCPFATQYNQHLCTIYVL